MILSDVRRSISREELNKLISNEDTNLIENISYEDSLSESIFTSRKFDHVDFVNCYFKNLQAQFAFFERCNFINCEMQESNFSCGQFNICGINSCNIVFSRFSKNWIYKTSIKHGMLSDSNFKDSAIIKSDFENSNIDHCSFKRSTIKETKFIYSNLNHSSFAGVKFSDTKISNCQTIGTDFSQSNGLLNPIDFLIENFEWTNQGVIVYKIFDFYYWSPWKDLKPGIVITEEANHDRSLNCACGINVGNKKYLINEFQKIKDAQDIKVRTSLWKCIIKFPWLSGVVIPYNTEGDIRCSRLQLIHSINKGEFFSSVCNKESKEI